MRRFVARIDCYNQAVGRDQGLVAQRVLGSGIAARLVAEVDVVEIVERMVAVVDNLVPEEGLVADSREVLVAARCTAAVAAEVDTSAVADEAGSGIVASTVIATLRTPTELRNLVEL